MAIYDYYETMVILKADLNNLDTIHKQLDEKIRESFLGKLANSDLRHQAGAVPPYRYYPGEYTDGDVLCLVRSEIPLRLKGERKLTFNFNGGEFKFKTFMCLNRKQGSKLTFASREDIESVTITPKLLAQGIDKVSSISVDEYKRGYVKKNGNTKFFFMGAMVEVKCQVAKETAYSLFINGLGIKAVYGYGLILE